MALRRRCSKWRSVSSRRWPIIHCSMRAISDQPCTSYGRRHAGARSPQPPVIKACSVIIKAWPFNHRSAFDASGLIKTSLNQLDGVTPEVVLRLRRDWRRRDLGEAPGEIARRIPRRIPRRISRRIIPGARWRLSTRASVYTNCTRRGATWPHSARARRAPRGIAEMNRRDESTAPPAYSRRIFRRMIRRMIRRRDLYCCLSVCAAARINDI